MTTTITTTLTLACEHLYVAGELAGIEREFDCVDVQGVTAGLQAQRCEVAYFEFEAEKLSMYAIPELILSAGWIPANTRQLLAFAKANPEAQLKGKPIIGLNAVTETGENGYRRCMYLSVHNGKRFLQDGGIQNRTVPAFRFLAVRYRS